MRNKDPSGSYENRRLKSLVQKTIRDAQRNHWRDYCAGLNEHIKLGQVWKTNKRISDVSSRHALLTKDCGADATLFMDYQSKAHLFAQNFASVSSNQNLSPEFQVLKAQI